MATSGRWSAEFAEYEAEKKRRFAGAGSGATCKFCRGAIDLDGEYCEQCGAPVSEAAPGMAKSAPPSATASAPSSTSAPVSSRATGAKGLTAPPGNAGRIAASRAQPPAAGVTSSANLSVPSLAPSGAAGVASSVQSISAPTAAPVAAGPSRAADGTQEIDAVAEPSQKIPLAIGIALLVVGLTGTLWYFLRPKPKTIIVPAQPHAVAAPGVEAPAPSALVKEPPALPKRSRAAKAAPAKPAAAPAPDARRAEIVSLQNLAREAYVRGNYAEPPEESAIAYAKRVLAIDHSDSYSKTILEDAVKGGKYQVQKAVGGTDFTAAHRVAGALAQLLPDRSDIKGLNDEVAAAERAAKAAAGPGQGAGQTVRFRLTHMHSDKSPAANGPYCVGTLTASGAALKYAGETATDGKVHDLDIACSEIRELRKNTRVAAKLGAFHVRTRSANMNFVPEDPSKDVVPALKSACSR